MAAKQKAGSTERFRDVRNAKAKRDYFLSDPIEAGIALKGTEIKSIRTGKVQIKEAFVRIDKGIPMLYRCHISEYSHGNLNNHNPVRPRRLLLNKREINRYRAAVEQQGLTIVPVRLYFKGGLAKMELALGQGKKLHDKRHDMRQRVEMREAERAVAGRMRGR